MPSQRAATATLRDALAAGFDRAFLVAAGVSLVILIVAVVTVRRTPATAAEQDLPEAR